MLVFVFGVIVVMLLVMSRKKFVDVVCVFEGVI